MKKHIIKYFVFFLLVNITFLGCEEDSNMPYEGLVTEGVPLAALYMTDNSDVEANVELLSQLSLGFETAILYEGVASVDLMVALNDDYTNAGLIETVSTFPSTFQEVTIEDIVAALSTVSDSNVFVSGDELNFYLNVTGDNGSFYPGYLETGERTQPASQASIPGHEFNHRIPCVRYCAVNVDNIVGTWSGTDVDTWTGEASVSCTIEKVDDVTFVVKTNSGVPIFCQATWADWGEVFQSGFGNEGDVYFTVDESGNLTSEETYWGETLPGPWDYLSTASGRYFACDNTMQISFIMDDGWITSETELTKD